MDVQIHASHSRSLTVQYVTDLTSPYAARVVSKVEPDQLRVEVVLTEAEAKTLATALVECAKMKKR